ncbi:MAG: hypothetical protein ABR520_04535, partial [Mycobacteriales bacterium]
LRFNGSTLPVKPGQVVNIFYRSGATSTLAIQARTDIFGRYAVQRRFLACPVNLIVFARINADIHNLAGASPDRFTRVHH